MPAPRCPLIYSLLFTSQAGLIWFTLLILEVRSFCGRPYHFISFSKLKYIFWFQKQHWKLSHSCRWKKVRQGPSSTGAGRQVDSKSSWPFVLSFSTLEPQAASFLEKQKRRMWRGETLSTSPVCSRETGRWEEVRMQRKLSSQIIGIFGSRSGSVVKKKKKKKTCLPMQETQEMQVRPLGWEDPWRRKWQPIPVFLPGEFHG